MEDERIPLLEDGITNLPLSRSKYDQTKLAEHLESNSWHLTVIGLTALDALFVLIQLVNARILVLKTLRFLEYFSLASIIITALFLTEVPLALFAFGKRYFTTVEHAWLHLFDAIVILTTFILEVFLRGREAEIAALLIILRLWRLIKLVSTVSVGVTEFNEVENARNDRWKVEKDKLLRELDRVKSELDGMREEIGRLER